MSSKRQPVMPTYDFRTKHGVQFSTFSPPALDGSLTLAEIVEHHAKHSPDHIYACFVQNGQLQFVTWKQLGTAMHVASSSLLSKIGTKRPAVAVLANRDTLTYVALLLGILRTGCIACLLSPKNSAAGLAHLLKSTNAEYLFAGEDDVEAEMINEALVEVGEDRIQKLSAPFYQDLYVDTSAATVSRLPDLSHSDPQAITIYLHSSGSTAFPKPIPFSHIFLLQWIRSPMYGYRDLADQTVALQAVPPYHASGFYQAIGVPASTGARVSLFAPAYPPPLATPHAVLSSWKDTKSTFVITPPANLITWSQDEATVQYLASLDWVRNTGGPLPKAIGDYLAGRGVNLYQGWGSTEIGPVTVTVAKESYGLDWEWIELQANTHPIFEPQDEEGKTFELIFKCTPTHVLALLTDQEKQLYHTNDLVEKHSTKPGLIRIVGRKDDQIMLSTGEKTNPGPLENIIRASPDVKACIYFGRARFQNGVLVQPSQDFDTTNVDLLAAYRNKIWAKVEEANQFAPSHSRLFKEMILVTPPNKPLFYTTKGSVARPRSLEAFEAEINQLYGVVESSASTSVSVPSVFSLESTLRFVTATVEEVISKNQSRLLVERDLFQQGCDSLQATFIRNRLVAALKSRKVKASLGPDFVYRHPSIVALSEAIVNIVEERQPIADQEEPHQILEQLITKYSDGYATRPSFISDSETQQVSNVLITGTTGSLGCHLLETFCRDPNVKVVYALNRPSQFSTVEERQRRELIDKGLDPSSTVFAKIVYLTSDASLKHLGLAPDIYKQLKQDVTLAIHNAWRLDFNIGLASFEPNLAALRNLIDLCLASDRCAKMINISSISSISNQDPDKFGMITEALSHKCNSAPMGYGQSKYASEVILAQAVKTDSSFQGCSIRVGQLCGSRRNGAWKTTDAVSMLIQSGQSLKCLPDAGEVVTWLPLDVAAVCIKEIAFARNLPVVAHLVHPNPVTWTSLFTQIAAAMKIPLTSWEEWVRRLLENNDMNQVPALKLQAYFIAKASKAEAASSSKTRLSTAESERLSPTLKCVPCLDQGDVDLWLRYWKAEGFLSR